MLSSSDVFITLRCVPRLPLFPKLPDAMSSQDICDNFQKQVHCRVLWDPSLVEINPGAYISFPPAYDALGRPPAPDRHFQFVSTRPTPPVQVSPSCDCYHIW